MGTPKLGPCNSSVPPLLAWIVPLLVTLTCDYRKPCLHADTLFAGTDRGNLEAARQYNGVLIREAGCKKKSGVGSRGYCFGLQDDRKLQRRGPTISKRPEVGSGGEVLRPEELLRCARILASPLLSTPERPWPAPDEFGSPGSRQNNFGEFDTTIVDSIR